MNGVEDSEKEIDRILTEADEKFTTLNNSLKNLRPDEPYSLRFDPPGSPSRRPIGSKAKEEKHILSEIDHLKDDTYKSVEQFTKGSPIQKQQETLSRIDQVFYPGEDKGPALRDRLARTKDIGSSMDVTEKLRLDEKMNNLRKEEPSTLTPKQHNELNITPPKFSTTLTPFVRADRQLLEDMRINKSDIEKEPEP